MLERDIEKAVVVWARKQGLKPVKMNGFGYRGMLDRMFLSEKGGKVAFVEFKATGEKPTRLQELCIRDLQDRGFCAGWFDDIEAAKTFLETVFCVDR